MIDNLLGQTLNRYKITTLLGEGGMGAVYRAQDTTLQRDVALKVMHGQFARNATFRERFLQEARTAARLDHPSIVKVFDFGQAQSVLYLVMEFIAGANLKDMLAELRTRKAWIRLDEAVQLVQHISKALDVAHQGGVLHRDIKPANIMLKPQAIEGLPYLPVLTDLGLAKLVEGQQLTQEGASMGTPAYMSPEQALGQPLDRRSDVYSLGILMYELATGRVPFPARSITEAIRYHTQETPPSPRSFRPDLPSIFEKVILKALAKKPSERFADAGQFAEALQYVHHSTTEVADSAPTTLESAVSLLTQYQQSLLEPRGDSLFDEFTPVKGLSQHRVQIMGKDKTTHAVVFSGTEMTMGRGEENDLVLDSVQVSRAHAKVTFDGNQFHIIDLNSKNGTYLGDIKLLAGVSEIWRPDQALRVGEFYLRLVRADQEAVHSSTEVYRADGTAVDRSLIHTSAGEGRVNVFLEESHLTAQPGGTTHFSITLFNQSEVVDHFLVALQGLPETWLSEKSRPIQLMPGSQKVVVLSILPPRNPQSRAGRHPFTIFVSSQDRPEQVVTVKATLTVAPYWQFKSELHPQRVSVGKPARVSISNLGNIRESFEVLSKDRADELHFEPPLGKLQVPEGETAHIDFQPSLRKRPWLGGSQAHAFTTEVRSSQGESLTHHGEVMSRGRIPLWLLPASFFACILFAATSLFGFNQYRQQIVQATQSMEVTQTAAAQVALLLDTDQDGLTDVEEAKLGTAINSADSDADGVNDKKEVEADTNPLNADSDGDELSDGQEQVWNTNPKVPDSDGDTVPDGTEVSQGSSPTLPDTDGDGLNDNVDPDPGQLPTLTPTSTITPLPTETPLPTLTPTPTIPAGGVSLNCDGTYQRLLVSDGGTLGKTVSVANLENGVWVPVWSINSGDPMTSQFEEETGFYTFGSCQHLLVVPVRVSGSGAVLQLVIYTWTGLTMQQVFEQTGIHGAWNIETDRIRLQRSVYLYGEPNCCPCNQEIVYSRWTGTEFIEDTIALEPTYSGTAPAECQGGVTPFPTFDIPPIIIITPLPIILP